jgi:hypothetical protein
VIANKPDEVERCHQLLIFFMGDIAIVFQIPACFKVGLNGRNPAHRMVIPQAAAALLETGFQQIGRIPELTVARHVGIHQAADHGHLVFRIRQTRVKGFQQARKQAGHAAQKAGIQKRSKGFDAFFGQRQAVGQTAGGVADVNARVPQGIHDFLNQLIGFCRNIFFKQKQQIHI